MVKDATIWQRVRGSVLSFLPPSSAQLRAEPKKETPLYSQVAKHREWLAGGAWLAGIEDPDVVLQRTGKVRADLRDILRDAEVTQALDTRKEAVLATPWRLEHGGTKRAAQFVEEEIRPHAASLIAACWNAVPYGYSVAEMIYARRAGRVGIGRVEEPPFEWFRPMPGGELRYYPPMGYGNTEGIEVGPPKFFLTARNATYRMPMGEALLSVLYWPVTWRLQGWNLWLNFLDTFGSPMMVGKVADFNAFVNAMKDQGVRHAVGWNPDGPNDAIEAITASAPGEFERLQDALNRCIWRTVLGQTLTSDTGKSGGGAYALGKVHNEVRDDKRRADIRIVSGTMQQVVNALWNLNGFGGMAPLFVMQDDVGLEAERAKRDKDLFAVGVRFEQSYFEERYDLEADDFTVTAAEPVDEEDDPDATPEERAEKAEQRAQRMLLSGASRFTPSQQVIERGIAKLIGKGGEPITVAALRSAILAATDRVDLEHRLALLIDASDPKFAKVLARAMFAADVLGYVHAKEETVPSPKD